MQANIRNGANVADSDLPVAKMAKQRRVILSAMMKGSWNASAKYVELIFRAVKSLDFMNKFSENVFSVLE